MSERDFKTLYKSGDVTIIGAGKYNYSTQSGYLYQISVPKELNEVERLMIVRVVSMLLKAKPKEGENHD